MSAPESITARELAERTIQGVTAITSLYGAPMYAHIWPTGQVSFIWFPGSTPASYEGSETFALVVTT